jgi:hypothetical protein
MFLAGPDAHFVAAFLLFEDNDQAPHTDRKIPITLPG